MSVSIFTISSENTSLLPSSGKCTQLRLLRLNNVLLCTVDLYIIGVSLSDPHMVNILVKK